MLTLNFYIKPRAVQSFRYCVRDGKVMRFADPQAREYKKAIATLAKSQLPKDFRPYPEGVPLHLDIRYEFAVPKCRENKLSSYMSLGMDLYHTTRPDLPDNLNKGLVDALKGLVFADDCQIASVRTIKVYAMSDRISVCLDELDRCGASLDTEDLFDVGV